MSHFSDRSPCTACDFVVNGLRKTCARYCIRFSVFYDGDKTSGTCLPLCARRFTFKMASKKTPDDETLVFSSDDEKKEGIAAASKRKYTGSFQYKVVFKESWKADYPVKAAPNNKHKFRCIPCGRNLSCHHQGLKDVKDHCGNDTHKMNLRGWRGYFKITSAYSPTNTPLKNKVLNAEVAVANFLVQHNLPFVTVDHLGPLFKPNFLIAKLVNPMAVLDKRQVLLSIKLFNRIATAILLSSARTTPIVLVTMDQMTRE